MNKVKEFEVFDKGMNVIFENDNYIFICFDKILHINANPKNNRIFVTFGYDNAQTRGVDLIFSDSEKLESLYSFLITR